MINKTILSMLMVAIMFGTTISMNAQEDSNDYKMWEDVMLTPDNTKLKVLADNMRKHNQMYHAEGPYKAVVYNIASGPNAGNIIWEMGPMKYKHNDTRPGEGAHDADWRDNVMPYIKKVQTIEYWTADKELNNTSMLDDDDSKYPVFFVRYFEVADGPTPGLRTFFERVSNTIKALEGVNPWGVYYNEFRQGDLGRHIATFSFMKDWNDFERDRNWAETFKKVNGESAWDNQRDLYSQTFKNSWDEIWTYNAYMSGK